MASTAFELIVKNILANNGIFNENSATQIATDNFIQQYLKEEISSGNLMARVFKDNSCYIIEMHPSKKGFGKLIGIYDDYDTTAFRTEVALFGGTVRKNKCG